MTKILQKIGIIRISKGKLEFDWNLLEITGISKVFHTLH